MARVRLWGELTPSGREELGLRWYNLMPEVQLTTLLGASYGVGEGEATAAAARRPAQHFADLPPVLKHTL